MPSIKQEQKYNNRFYVFLSERLLHLCSKRSHLWKQQMRMMYVRRKPHRVGEAVAAAAPFVYVAVVIYLYPDSWGCRFLSFVFFVPQKITFHWKVMSQKKSKRKPMIDQCNSQATETTHLYWLALVLNCLQNLAYYTTLQTQTKPLYHSRAKR